jgi:hypothetical protein
VLRRSRSAAKSGACGLDVGTLGRLLVGLGRRVVGQHDQFRLDCRECGLCLAHFAFPCCQPCQPRQMCAGTFESSFGFVAQFRDTSQRAQFFGQTGTLRFCSALAIAQRGDLAIDGRQHGLRVPGVTEQLAATLQVGPDAGHFRGKSEAPLQVRVPQ